MNYGKELSLASIERQVEDIYNEILRKNFGNIHIEYPFACDGYVEFKLNDNIQRLLIEYKYDFDMQSVASKAKVLCQVLYYIKKFEQNGKVLPNVIFVADKNECFVIHSNPLLKYLDFDGVDWSKAPSSAGCNMELVLALSEDRDINPFVFDVNEKTDFSEVIEKIRTVASGTVRLIHVTEHNIDKIFKVFSEKVVTEKKYPSNDMVALFFNIMTGSEDVFLHPTKRNTLVANGKNVKVDSGKFKAFCGHFATTCSPREKARLAAISDRLIEDTNRRRKGEFYTPTAFVDYSHGMISKQFGEDWKEKYYVWDCACGTKNLTRDYKFSHLFCSTLEQAELDISKNYNPEAASFQFDFLNDELKRKSEGGNVPDELMDALDQNKPIIFYINPPYANSGGMMGEGIGFAKNTVVRELMCKNRISASEIYAQFLYRIYTIQSSYGLQNCNIALFCKPKFLCGESFSAFRKIFLSKFSFDSGMIFQASEFADVSSQWGITFNIWRSGETIDKNCFIHDIIKTSDDGSIVNIGKKTLYNLDNTRPLKTIIPKTKRIQEYPNWKRAFECSEDSIMVSKDFLGCIYQGMHNAGASTLMYYKPGGYKYCIEPTNIDECAQFFSVNYLKPNGWLYDKDDLRIPNTNDLEFIYDSIVFMIFGMYDFSLRQVKYHDKLWGIKNNFFWQSKSVMEELAEKHNIDEMYNEAHSDTDRFVYTKLQNLTLSPEAKAVLDKANELLEKSMKYRKLFNDEKPEMQILNWDAGWYQLKQMLKTYMPNDLKEFNAVYKNLVDKMRPMIYELGFLRK